MVKKKNMAYELKVKLSQHLKVNVQSLKVQYEQSTRQYVILNIEQLYRVINVTP